jgi:predicted RNA-binding Zn-ribbon protein involved in translation (DUF1610 family)
MIKSSHMAGLITLQCPSCGARSALGPDDAIFTCPYCGNQAIFNLPTVKGSAVFSPQPQQAMETGGAASAVARPRPIRPRPRQVRVEQKPATKKDGPGLIFTWRWFNTGILFLFFFCVAWDAFLCFWYGTAISSGNAPWIMFVFPVAHLAVGVGLSYYCLAAMLNVTTLEVTPKRFIVRYDPVPWLGETNIETNQVEQLYCKQKVNSGRNGVSYSYQLCAVLKDQRQLNLVSGLETAEIAAFLEEQIEKWLRISDEPVIGEMAK